jgi:hypothetical protein
MKIFFLVVCLVFPIVALSNYEMVVIQSVSSTGKTFVTRTGKKTGDAYGQKAAFTTENFSLVAQATTVTREFTVWEVVEEEAKAPFENGQVVTVNNDLNSLWFDVPRHPDIQARIIPPLESQSIKLNRNPNFIGIGGGLSYTASESISGVIQTETTRNALSLELSSGTKLIGRVFLNIHGRAERERSQSESVSVSITRYNLLGSVSYHFTPTLDGGEHFYAGVGAGIGKCSSVISDEKTPGSTWILPSLYAGFEHRMNEHKAFYIEGLLEAISQTDQLLSGDTQISHFINTRLAAGVKLYFR